MPATWPTNTRLIRFQLLWARTDCAGWKDAVLLNLAESEARIMLTLDKDFWQIAVQRRVPLEQSGVVLFRVHPATPENLEPLVSDMVRVEAQKRPHLHGGNARLFSGGVISNPCRRDAQSLGDIGDGEQRSRV